MIIALVKAGVLYAVGREVSRVQEEGLTFVTMEVAYHHPDAERALGLQVRDGGRLVLNEHEVKEIK